MAEATSELVGTVFTARHFARASLLPPALPPHVAEHMFHLTGVKR